MLRVTMLRVATVNVVMLSVVAPLSQCRNKLEDLSLSVTSSLI